MKRALFSTILIVAICITPQAQVVIDGFFDDWENVEALADTEGDDGDGLDILSVSITDDADRLYIQVRIAEEVNLQEVSNLAILLNIDNDASTGGKLSNFGYEIAYFVGDRVGVVVDGNRFLPADFQELGFVFLPTVSSRVFEFTFLKSTRVNGVDINLGDQVTVGVLDANEEDRWPDTGDYVYAMQSQPVYVNPSTRLGSLDRDFRLVSYNSRFDGLFASQGSVQEGYMVDVQPDIVLWQELFDANNPRLRSALENMTVDWPEVHVSTSPGIGVAMISRWPILDDVAIDGNAAYLVDLDTDTILVINVHYPCCDNDFDRQREVDRVMQFIREVQSESAELDVPDNAPIILAGDMNLVGSARQYTAMITGNILFNGQFGPDFLPDYDGSNLADAVPLVLGSNLAYTWFNTDQSFAPGRLDLCLYTDSRLELLNAFGYRPSDNQPSDHIPLVVDFNIKELVSTAHEADLNNAIEIAPNPARDQLVIESSVGIVDVRLVDLTGQSVLHTTDLIVDVSGLSSGVYVCIVQAEEVSYREKVTIVR